MISGTDPLNKRPIGIFDSGVGGLTVVKQVMDALPCEAIVYFGDTARVPYGTKSARAVQAFAVQDTEFLLRQNVKMVIVACHTASSVALTSLAGRFDVPILGVVEPGVDSALKNTKNGKIGVIGTRGTIASRTYEEQLLAKDPGVQVFPKACPLFVPFAEEGWLEGEIIFKVAETYLKPFRESGIDTLILGCTHYPLLKRVIAQVLGEGVALIDSATETARVVRKRLYELKIANDSQSVPEHRFTVSDIPEPFRDVGERFLGKKLGRIEQIDLEKVQA
ncbi:glutamate racemase [bacterium]|nr:glutamate racemase [bacterium]